MIPALLLAASLQMPPSPAKESPEDMAAAMASLTLVSGCFLTLSAYDKASEYAAASELLGRNLDREMPEVMVGVTIDGAQGRGCRTAYSGPKADRVWAADLKFLRPLAAAPNDPRNGCVFTADTPTRLAGVCVSTGEVQNGRPALTRRADVLLERSGDGPTADVTAAVTNSRP